MPENPPEEKLPLKSFSEMALSAPARKKADRMTRPGWIPQCPRCGCDLTGTKHETGIAWRCGSCGGQSLNFSQFRRMIPELHANEIWLTAMEHPVAPRRQARCPECHKDMAAVLIPFQGMEIELDICRICQRLWMENPENQTYRLDISDRPPAPKPPVIRMTGRGVEKLRKIQERMRSGSEETTFDWDKWLIVLIIVLIWILLRR